MGRRLTDTFPIEELLQMRESGMTNRDIANAVGCHYTTILNLLGKEEKERRSPRTYNPTPKKQAEPEEAYEAKLVLQNKKIELHGRFGAYSIDCKDGNVAAEINDTLLIFNLEELDDFIGELQAIKRKTGELTVKNEMW